MPDADAATRPRSWLSLAGIVLLGLAITSFAFWTATREEERRVVRSLERQVDWRANDIYNRLDDASETLFATAIHVAAKPTVDLGEFDRFTTEAHKSGKPITAIDWVPLVKRADRASFEAAAGVRIQENDLGGTRVTAPERDSYTPIMAQTRFSEFPVTIGYDLSSEPARREAAVSARDSGEPRSVLVPQPLETGTPTYLVFWPIFSGDEAPTTIEQRRERLRGYVVGVFRVLDILRDAIATSPFIAEAIDFTLGSQVPEIAAAEGPRRLVANYAPGDRSVRAVSQPSPASAAEYRFLRNITIRGEIWQLASFFSPEAVAAERSIGPLAILVGGLLLTAFLAFFVFGGMRQVSIVQALVMRRTAELVRTNTKLAALVDASPYAIICLEPDQTVSVWSTAAEQLFGYDAEEVIGHPYPLVVPGEEKPFAERIADLSRGAVLRNVVSRRRHKDGSIIDTSGSAAAFYDSRGRLLGIMFAIEDIRKRTQVERQLQQAQKMEAIGQLTGGMAHDFNNLLGIILGNLDLLAEQCENDPEQKELADAAILAATRGADLTRQLLAFARRQPLTPKVIDPAMALEGTTQLLRRTLGESIGLEVRIASGIWPLLIDVSQLQSSILNLAVNARDAMPDGGRLTIEARNAVLDDGAIELNPEAAAGEYVVITVSDTGSGMLPEILSQVFQPFFTTKGSKGSGLGLSMVHGFVKQSGGHTKIYSEPGRGTTISIYLPRAKDSGIETAQGASAGTPAAGSELVLVVEDNKGMREVALRQLQSLGYRTIPAEDAAHALEIIRGGASIDLLFTDMVMPGGMDGRALAEAARRHRPGIKVLFTSGFTEAAASAALHGEFTVNLLSKPYRKEDLARRLRTVIDNPEQ